MVIDGWFRIRVLEGSPAYYGETANGSYRMHFPLVVKPS